MRETYDAAIVGSGFGGSVAALRLAEAGLSVAVFERGRWWTPEEFPRRDRDIPRVLRTRLTPDGLYDERRFDGVTVYAGNGVGGGSLVYSNVLIRAPRAVLDGFPEGLRADDLEPRYRRVLAMMRAAPARPPEGEPAWRKSAHLRSLAERLAPDLGARWRPVELAVHFDGRRPLPPIEGWPHSGRAQEGCIGCGLCNVGCHLLAKNTLDLTYLPAAMRAGARIFARCEVIRLEAAAGGGGYLVHVRDRARGERRCIAARRVVLAAGALGTTELLLRARARGDLGRVSDALGTRFSVNGDHLATAFGAAEPTRGREGPIIVSAIEFPDPAGRGRDALVEDGGSPALFSGFFARTLPHVLEGAERLGRALRREGVRGALDALRALPGQRLWPRPVDERTLTLLVMMRDAADGRASLDAAGNLAIRWRWEGSAASVARINEILAALGRAAGARIPPAPIWLRGRAHTVHPLGGCPIGEDPRTAVVSPRGEVFGHPGLYVADGSILPAAAGVNPSLTIAALAEAIAEGIAAGAR